MTAQLAVKPSLSFNADPHRPKSGAVDMGGLDPDTMTSLCGYLRAGGLPQAILSVRLTRMETPSGDDLPAIHGRYQLLEDGIRFVPHFSFERGLSYRASFDPRPLGLSGLLTLDIPLPPERSASVTSVTDIFPSSGELPENLLRFSIGFSGAMRRGRAASEIAILGPDGKPAQDVLYRAPVELWDRSMRQLTLLLDPGRLKRGVGPNRELGPPLKAGHVYTLAVGAGMTDIAGNPLAEPVCKSFRVTDAVRVPIAVDEWSSGRPKAPSREPLSLTFPRPLDRALLASMISIASPSGQCIEGRMSIDDCERRWSFTPASPWVAGSYQLRVGVGLEDVCGNTLLAAFDRPLRPNSDLVRDVTSRSIAFNLA